MYTYIYIYSLGVPFSGWFKGKSKPTAAMLAPPLKRRASPRFASLRLASSRFVSLRLASPRLQVTVAGSGRSESAKARATARRRRAVTRTSHDEFRTCPGGGIRGEWIWVRQVSPSFATSGVLPFFNFFFGEGVPLK